MISKLIFKSVKIRGHYASLRVHDHPYHSLSTILSNNNLTCHVQPSFPSYILFSNERFSTGSSNPPSIRRFCLLNRSSNMESLQAEVIDLDTDHDDIVILDSAPESSSLSSNITSTQNQRKLLKEKLSLYRVPLQQLKLNYPISTADKEVYTEEEDRFLLVMLDRYGVDGEGIYDKIWEEIRESPLFRFDWFLLSRTPIEIGRRCATLLNTIAREFEAGEGSMMNGPKGKDTITRYATCHTVMCF